MPFSTLTKNYTISHEIGHGRFGVVNLCHSSNGEPFACKSVNKTALTDTTDLQSLKTEPKILTLLSHSPSPYILTLHAVYETPSHLHLITDLCPNGDLFDLLSTSSPLPEHSAASIFYQLMSALAHCHNMGVAHRDVKPDNILFDNCGQVKLADFGSAEFFGDDEGMSGVVGTPYYVAPEVLLGRRYDEKVDVWSAGVILYVMLAGFPPFYGEGVEETFEKVLRGNLRFPREVFGGVSNEAKDLIRKMVCRDVDKRLSAEQVLRHPWILKGEEKF